MKPEVYRFSYDVIVKLSYFDYVALLRCICDSSAYNRSIGLTDKSEKDFELYKSLKLSK